jgi:amidohydrolase
MLIPVLTALYGIRSRLINPMDPGILSIGEVSGGNASNVIPSEIFIQGTLRSYSPEVRELLANNVLNAFKAAENAGGRGVAEIDRGYPAGWNDARVINWMGEIATEMLGPDAIDNSKRIMAGEDFAYMCQAAPGAMLSLGAKLDDGVHRAHHTPLFDIDERALPIGAAILAETAIRFLKGSNTL